MKNDIVIVGNGGRNGLGIMREFGECGIIPFMLILENDNVYQKSNTKIVLASKYAKRYKVFPFSKSIEKDAVKFLLDRLGNEECKPIIITTNDVTCEMLDRHVEELSEKFFVSNVAGKNGGVHHYLDKYNTYMEIKETEIKTAETFVVNLPVVWRLADMPEYPMPCILKPRESAHGMKMDIEICHTKTALLNALKKFEERNYTEVLLQEYLDYDYEFSIHGYVAGEQAFVPGICRYLHKKSIGTTDYMYVQYVKLENCIEENFVKNLCEFMKNIQFQGCFVGEAFYRKDGTIYLNEMNYRTCDLSYNETPSGHYIAPEYAAERTGGDPREFVKEGKDSFYAVLTFAILRLALQRKISLWQAMAEIKSASSYQYYAKGDAKPLFAKLGICGKERKFHEKH